MPDAGARDGRRNDRGPGIGRGSGRQRRARSSRVKLDGTAPTITASVVPDGWANAASAAVTFTCSDATSGMAAPCPDPVDRDRRGCTTDIR